MSGSININDSYDTAILSVSDTGITCPQWTNFSSGDPGRGPGGPKDPGKEGNDDRAEVSAKGIKSDNEIFISTWNRTYIRWFLFSDREVSEVKEGEI